jgi:hypothetical protein
VVQESERRHNKNLLKVFTAIYNSIRMSKNILKAAKEKELANKLLGLLPRLYMEEVEQDNITKP